MFVINTYHIFINFNQHSRVSLSIVQCLLIMHAFVKKLLWDSSLRDSYFSTCITRLYVYSVCTMQRSLVSR